MIKALTLDLWNTLIEDEVGPLTTYGAMRVEALKAVLSKRRAVDADSILKAYLKTAAIREVVPPKLVAKIIVVLNGYDLGDPIVEEAARAYEESVYAYKPKIVNGAQELLEYAKKLGLKVVVVSNTSFSARAVAKVLENAGLAQYVDYVVSSSDTEVAKPNPRIFYTALRAVGVEPGEAVHLGDSCLKDAIGAYIVGMKPILLARSEEAAELCKNVPSLIVVKSLSEVLVILEGMVK